MSRFLIQLADLTGQVAAQADMHANDSLGPLDATGEFDPVGGNMSGAATNSGTLPLDFSEQAAEAHDIVVDAGPEWLPDTNGDLGPWPIYDFLS